jgi:hypothetical protein
MPQNLTIIYNNVADTATVTSATQASSSLGPANLLTDIKSQVCRSTGTSQTFTATWAAGQVVSGIALAFTTLSATATMRVRGYTLSTDTTPVFDTGANLAAPNQVLGLWNWNNSLSVNALTYGGGAYAVSWLTAASTVQKIVVDLVDTSNPAGFIDVGRLIIGSYWESALNADYGAGMTAVDTSKHFRNDAGDLMTDVGTRHKQQTISLSNLSADQRAILWNILFGNGMSRPVFLSLYPQNSDSRLEQAHMMWCKLVATPAVTIPYYQNFAASLQLEEI